MICQQATRVPIHLCLSEFERLKHTREGTDLSRFASMHVMWGSMLRWMHVPNACGALQSVATCGECFEMLGPANSTIAFYNYGGNSTLTYQLLLSWDPSYQGLITLDLIPPSRSVSLERQSCPCISQKLRPLLTVLTGTLWCALQGKCCLHTRQALRQSRAGLPGPFACQLHGHKFCPGHSCSLQDPELIVWRGVGPTAYMPSAQRRTGPVCGTCWSMHGICNNISIQSLCVSWSMHGICNNISNTDTLKAST